MEDFMRVCESQKGNYLTASFKAFAARNFGTVVAATWTVSPVFGFRAVRAARAFAEKIPSPASETSPPFFKVDVISSINIWTTSSAWTLVPPIFAWIKSASAALFMFIGTCASVPPVGGSDKMIRTCN